MTAEKSRRAVDQWTNQAADSVTGAELSAADQKPAESREGKPDETWAKWRRSRAARLIALGTLRRLRRISPVRSPAAHHDRESEDQDDDQREH